MSAALSIRAEGVTKRYFDGREKRFAVNDVNLEVAAGSVVALIGPSGSGKTTLLAMLGGLVTPTRGEVFMGERAIVQMRDHHRTAFRRDHVGFVFQELQLIEGMSLLKNVTLPLVPTGGARDGEPRARELLQRLGLADRASADVRRLSGGERQRGAIARALITAPSVLLLDEPSAHLDGDSTAALLDAVFELETTIVMSTHDARVFDDDRVDRVVRMRDGRLDLAEGSGAASSAIPL